MGRPVGLAVAARPGWFPDCSRTVSPGRANHRLHVAIAVWKDLAPQRDQFGDDRAGFARARRMWLAEGEGLMRLTRVHKQRCFEDRVGPFKIDVTPARTSARVRGAGRPRAAATRSSAKSGDSPDDDPAPPAPRGLRAEVVA